MTDIESILASAKRPEKSVTLCMRGDLNAKYEELHHKLAEVAHKWVPKSLGDVDPAKAIAEEMDAVRLEMQQHETVFRFEALPHLDWSNLRAAHAARNDQEGFNLDTMPFALISASSAEPKMDEDQVSRLFDVLNDAQRDLLFEAAWSVNMKTVDVPFSGLASNVMRSSEAS